MAFFFCSRKSVAGILNYLTLGIKDLDALALDKDREAEQRNVEAVTAPKQQCQKLLTPGMLRTNSVL